jgi:hypothetical protein
MKRFQVQKKELTNIMLISIFPSVWAILLIEKSSYPWHQGVGAQSSFTAIYANKKVILLII